ncbi:hypothetical protein EYF80_007075 [Liparis tanakae]|uniref:Uncharacterized protein n=1 Tax=Liparis tanakae TaxID=230148 RepID=A0A4Z2IXR0_9TELE|nr:hypothetical protein EYF80_007075 [Liparis tanakae]
MLTDRLHLFCPINIPHAFLRLPNENIGMDFAGRGVGSEARTGRLVASAVPTGNDITQSLSGGGEGLFLRPLPRDLDPPLRQALSSSSLMGVEGLCTVSKSPERERKHRRG